MKWTRGSLQGIPSPASLLIAGCTTGSGANETGTTGRRRRQRPVRTGPERRRLQQTEMRPGKGCRVAPLSPEPADLQEISAVSMTIGGIRLHCPVQGHQDRSTVTPVTIDPAQLMPDGAEIRLTDISTAEEVCGRTRLTPSDPVFVDDFGAHNATIPSNEFTVTTDQTDTANSAASIAARSCADVVAIEENRVDTGKVQA